MNEKIIYDRLVEKGKISLAQPKKAIISFTENQKADELLNDLTNHPHAFVLGCIMDRQISARRAWLIPYEISKRIDDFSINKLKSLSLADVNDLMSKPHNLHRFNEKMSVCFYSAVQRIDQKYAGNASCIWSSNPTSAEAVYRFLEFDGVGPKIASMAVNILSRLFKIPFSDHYSIDISPDVHVRRVFGRLGFCAVNASPQIVIWKAKTLYPKFPGIIDPPCWEIGFNWCHATKPECGLCYMHDLCPSAIQ